MCFLRANKILLANYFCMVLAVLFSFTSLKHRGLWHLSAHWLKGKVAVLNVCGGSDGGVQWGDEQSARREVQGGGSGGH